MTQTTYSVGVSQLFWSLLSVQRVPGASGPMRRDWVIVTLFVPVVILEVIVRDDLAWPVFALVFGMLPLAGLPWRRTHPLLVVAIGFGLHILGDIALLFDNENSAMLFSSAWVLLLPYALVRWGSGRDAMLGVAIVVATHAHAFDGFVEAIFGIGIMLLPAEIGYAVRNQVGSRSRAVDEIKRQEREQIARELHDTVAHHVSAIAIQAQAGRTVAGADPASAISALEVIEEAASRTLVEMRAMVSTLRSGDGAEFAPQRGVADIERLCDDILTSSQVDVSLLGDLATLRPTVDAALYRIAQESITNALRHAHEPTRVSVVVIGEPDMIRLTVDDDGAAKPFSPPPLGTDTGYGVEGMAERAALLGGTLTAGPSGSRGWTVTAALPRTP